jgi:hypothetical protein
MRANKKQRAYNPSSDKTIPNVFDTKLTSTYRLTGSGATSYNETVNANSIFRPFGSTGARIPYGKLELDGLYQEYLVKACKVTVFLNVGSASPPTHLFIWSSPSIDTPSPMDWENLAEIPGVKHLFVEPEGPGQEKKKISMYRTITSMLGHELTSNNKADVTASPAEIPWFHIAACSEDGTNTTCTFYVKVKQYVSYMQRKLL